MMKKVSLVIMVFIYSICSLQAQEIRSSKSFIYLKNKKNKEPAVSPDTIPPFIKIISPEFSPDKVLQYNNPEIDILGKITDDQSGINRIFINSLKFELTVDGLFVQKIPLTKGNNEISIIAVDNNDNYAKKSLRIEYVPESSLFTAHVEIKGKYYALIIGINEYEDPSLTNLDYPVNDAKKLYNILVSKYLFEKENVILLKNVTRAEINNALDMLAQKVTHDDNLLIFYAGHGWWDEKVNIGYWLPSDSKKTLKAEWFRNSTLCDYIREIDSRHTLLITDACFGGSIFKTRSISMEAPKAIQMLYDLPSRKAMTSGTLTEVPDRSSFTKYLLERLNDNNKKYISSEQLFSSFRIAVINNSDAIPQYGEIKNVGDEGGDFIFFKKE